jgi:hypothetical protein
LWRIANVVSYGLHGTGEGSERTAESSRAQQFSGRVGAAVLANNLMIIAALLTKRSARRRKATR